MRQPQPRRRTVVRYVDAAGRRCAKGDPGAQAVRTQTATWYAKMAGRWVSLGTTDLGTAWGVLRRLQREAADRAAGIRTDAQDAAREPLEGHVEAWAAHLDAHGTAPKHRAHLLHDVRWLAREGGWTNLAQLTAESLECGLALLRDAGRSAQTRKMYRQHACQFAAWCVRTRRLPVNPFVAVPVPNVQADRRLVHRCPTSEELGKLFAHLTDPACPTRCRARGARDEALTGPQRAMGYKVCLGTGFRAKELRSLRREWFDLSRRVVVLPARKGKNRRPVSQPLPGWLVEQLATYFGTGGPTWERFPSHDPGQILDADLQAAGVALTLPGPEAPESFTFHSFRVHFISELCADPHNDLKTIMELARHSDPKLTMKIYARFRETGARGALDRLPPPGQVRP